jgi:hypothetical protein
VFPQGVCTYEEIPSPEGVLQYFSLHGVSRSDIHLPVGGGIDKEHWTHIALAMAIGFVIGKLKGVVLP